MPRDDDWFWLDIFKRAPITASFMALGCLVGLGVGLFFFLDPRLISVRLILCLIFSCTMAGGFVGLIVGVIVDTFIGTFRSDKKKKPKKPRDSIRDCE